MMGNYTMIFLFINLLKNRLLHIGQIPLCNGIASRAPHIFGFCFPLCYRCTFVLIGYLMGFVLCKKRCISFMVGVLFLLPMIIDGGLQTFLGVMSNNVNRSITGLFFGVGLALCVRKISLKIDEM